MKPKKAKDIMTSVVVTVRPEAMLTEAIKLLLRHSVSGLPVVDADENLVGIITEHDIMNFAFSGHAAETTVAETMTRDVITYSPDTDMETLVHCYATKRIIRVPILEGKKLVGIISRRDILREMDHIYSTY